MKKIIFSSIFAILSISITFLFFAFKEKENTKTVNTAGEVTFTVRTVQSGGNYAPRHVLAIWIEKNGDFVKTRKAMANQRKQYLYTWKAASDYNTVDAITGPTLNSHQTHTVSWDCTDLDGMIVPDGEYEVWVEFTDKHAQGPLYTIAFDKGTETQSMTPPDETYFKDLELVYTPFAADFMANVTDICQYGEVVYTDNSSGASIWEWDFGDGASPATASTEGPHTVTYETPGPKSISLTINSNITETKENYVTVGVVPTAGFTFAGSDYTIEFTNTSTNANSYNWDFGDGNSSTDNNPSHTYAVAGSYNVTLIATYLNCEDTISQEVSVPMVNINEFTSKEEIHIYPNPNQGIFILEIPEGIEFNSIRIIDQSGRSIKNIETKNYTTENIQIDLGEIENGLYFIEIISNQSTLTKKFLVRY